MKKPFLIILFCLIVISPTAVLAQYTPLEPLPCIPGNGVVCTDNPEGAINFQQYVQQTFNLVIALAGAAAVFMIVLGGFQYMTTDSWTDKKDGLEKARKALLGLLLVLTSYLLLRTIDPRLVQIPNTLVKPLNIDEAAYHNEFFEQILSDANRFDEETERLRLQWEQESQRVKELDEQAKELEQKLTEANILGEEEQQRELGRQLAENAEARNAENASRIVNQAKTMMVTTVSNFIRGIGNDGLSKKPIGEELGLAIQSIDSRKNIANSVLNNLGAYDYTAKINDYAEYSKLSMRIRAQAVNITQRSNSSVSLTPLYAFKVQVNGDLDDMATKIESITDESLKQDLTTELEGVRDDLNKL